MSHNENLYNEGGYFSGGEESPKKLSSEDTDLIAAKLAAMILKDFRSFDCAACGQHFGYQSRDDAGILVCSTGCLAVARKNLRTVREGGHTGNGMIAGATVDWGSPLKNTVSVPPPPNFWNESALGVTKLGDLKWMHEMNADSAAQKTGTAEEAEDEWQDTGTKDAAVDETNSKLGAYKFTVDKMSMSPNLRSGDVCINVCEGPRILGVYAIADTNDIAGLTTVIEDHVGLNLVGPLGEIPSVGDVVLGPFEGMYYRAVVEEILKDNRVTVRFIDYGGRATVGLFDLLAVDEKIAEDPMYNMMIVIEEVPEEIVADVPEVIPELTPYIDNGASCRMELYEPVTGTPGYWNAELWFADGKNWSSVVMQAVEKKQASGGDTGVGTSA